MNWLSRLFQRPLRNYTDPGRLVDVLALIQVLGLDEHAHRSESGLRDELQGNPRSATTWTEVAKEHPEFFRVKPTGEHVVSLVARHVTPKNERDVRYLSPDFIGRLLDAAIELHDREVRRAERWAFWIPVLVAIIAGMFSLIAIALKAYVGSGGD